MGSIVFDSEDDVVPEPLPEGMVETVDNAIATIAEHLNVDPDCVIFKGFTLKFDVGGKPITFEGMKT